MNETTDQGYGVRGSIAIVDDDPSFLRSLARLLRVRGYTITAFGSGSELLASITQGPPACLLLDVQMPNMTGPQLQDALSARGLLVPTIFITAHDTPQTRELVHRPGTVTLLFKPFEESALLSAVDRARAGGPSQ